MFGRSCLLNELELFERTEKTMTVDEVAKTLGYDSEYLRKKCSELGFTKNGVKTLLNEEQVTKLKNELVPRTSDMKIRGQNAVTKLEMLQNIQRDMQWLISYNEELKAENERMKPKEIVYDDFLSRDKFCNFRDAANYFKVGQKALMDVLKSKYIYKNSVGEYRAYSEYAEYFTLRPFAKGGDRTGQQLMLNIKGMEFFKDKVGA